MIVCPNCSHANPDNASQCEACYTPLPASSSCPSCGATVQGNAHFCGQCGFDLRTVNHAEAQFRGIERPLEEVSMATVDLAFVGPPGDTTQPASFPETRLQVVKASLQHVQTSTVLELPQHLAQINIGKPNDLVPPDIDVSGFPDAEIVSRVHAAILVEGETYYIEDVGSSNGTYINHRSLPSGNRHKLRAGEHISLGKGDKVTFIFRFAQSG